MAKTTMGSQAAGRMSASGASGFAEGVSDAVEDSGWEAHLTPKTAEEADETVQDDGQNWDDVFLHAQDGQKLHARVYGHAGRKLAPVVCLPGLTRNAKDFHDLATYLSRDAKQKRMVVAIDYRGRGLSGRESDWRKYTIEQEAEDLLATLTCLNVGHAHFVGTSRGGLILHALSAIRPGMMKSIVLNDIGPVVEASGLARIKFYANHMKSYSSIEEAAAHMQDIHRNQFPNLDDAGWLKLAHQLYTQGNNLAEPDYDKKLLKALDFLDLTQPIPTLWPHFMALKQIPTIVLRGERSDILTPETVTKMEEVHPKLKAYTVKNEGHAPLLWDYSTQTVLLRHFNKVDGVDAKATK
ncbi:MAG: alpha/beta hydrolase [Rhizobiales bacterium]|nr:alpha/beta hydrolase [Hyphomicrobiales bacterium]